ncbi:MgtC/SapB family protein [Rhizobium sp. TRM95111]|uniref:MgtC/SapB family protein n=1 Tax=Rhizobium alarense TaxID=2846851 RepID=UPI001F46776C|nr:MgtC/SapB family protein [Rhizobium alarense]MCF3638491.1 MgtC/SapB family protein [Rhizobium alarense]
MQEILADFYPTTELSCPVIAARMLGAAVIGALVGVEREYRQHPAGLRTHILVSLAASVFAIISVESIRLAPFTADQVRIDPLRVVEAVTAGVAFLAAGMIVFSRGEVKNLTTGAGMWLAGSAGLAVGLGCWFIAGFAAVICLVVLGLLGRLEVTALPGERASGQRRKRAGSAPPSPAGRAA